MGLSVRSSRCAAVSMIIFGLLIYVPAGFYITFSLIQYNPAVWRLRLRVEEVLNTNILLKFSWYLGYTSLLALITSITGCIGVCASARRAHHDTCCTVTLFIFSMMVAGLSAYTIYDFSVIINFTRYILTNTNCSSLKNGCPTIFLLIEGPLLGLAVLVFLLSSWAMICCLASFCCHNEVEPEPIPARQQIVSGQQGVMVQGAVMVPMMRTDTVPVMSPPSYAMVQPVHGIPVNQGMPVAPVNQAPQQQSQAMPMQVVGVPNMNQEGNDGTLA